MTVEDHRLLDAGGTETSLFHTNVQRHKPLIYKDKSFDNVLHDTPRIRCFRVQRTYISQNIMQ